MYNRKTQPNVNQSSELVFSQMSNTRFQFIFQKHDIEGKLFCSISRIQSNILYFYLSVSLRLYPPVLIYTQYINIIQYFHHNLIHNHLILDFVTTCNNEISRCTTSFSKYCTTTLYLAKHNITRNLIWQMYFGTYHTITYDNFVVLYVVKIGIPFLEFLIFFLGSLHCQ